MAGATSALQRRLLGSAPIALEPWWSLEELAVVGQRRKCVPMHQSLDHPQSDQRDLKPASLDELYGGQRASEGIHCGVRALPVGAEVSVMARGPASHLRGSYPDEGFEPTGLCP